MNVHRVAVLLGGRSAEREVSLVSGKACAKALRERGHDVLEIDPRDGVAEMVSALQPKPDVVFNALHGHWGEDGCVQGLLELLDIPYTHSGVLASALAMDKGVAKKSFVAAGLPVAESVIASRAEVLAGDVMPRPYVVKPVAEGSSVGVEIIMPGANSLVLDEERWPYGDKVMVERFVPGRELTVAVMGERPLSVTEIRPRQGFYDYTAKYTDGKADHLLPAPLKNGLTEKVMEMALVAHRALGCRGVSRADFRFDEDLGEDGLIILEVNTQPGMTPLSLVPEQAAHVGIPFGELVEWIVEEALCRA
ncbi:D-alanine--D-alanine ligase [Limibacillus halophilus]|uniref:D-alanine--D-alanine ligase n=1 Tax=Limibacillus halophilus TaxID=1579333 RepID=A0A839SV69_9PROT|nr:D-alanine--D-alanine ligase [Limibacillus halophilus]MBB3064843.1 D-alanine-D-alanine ligase [Limibacillus halophilus]